jgi:hypothetical protein
MPTKVALPGPVTLIAVGAEHSCALLTDGQGLYCWGLNDVGQLGVPAAADPMKPVTVPVKSGFSPQASAVVVGLGFTCVLDSTGLVKCAGGRLQGTLGNGQDVKSDIPLGVPSLATVSALAGGQGHACALDKDGVVACWGQNKAGQCGVKASGSEEFAVHVAVPAADKIWSGSDITCVHTKQGETYCWGDNSHDLSGDAIMDQAPHKVALDKYSMLALGQTRACGVDGSGTIDCWGSEIATKPMNVLPPAKVDGITSPNAIVTGGDHHCAWSGGRVYCWGQNDCGQLGIGGSWQFNPTVVPF